MPGLNQTGPLGRGPMTGRGMGRCVGRDVTGYAGYMSGFGCRRGFRGGWWHGGRFMASRFRTPPGQWVSGEESAEKHEMMVETLKGQIDTLAKRLDSLEKREPSS